MNDCVKYAFIALGMHFGWPPTKEVMEKIKRDSSKVRKNQQERRVSSRRHTSESKSPAKCS